MLFRRFCVNDYWEFCHVGPEYVGVQCLEG